MINPFLFEEEFENESQFEDSFESFDNEYQGESEYEGDYEYEDESDYEADYEGDYEYEDESEIIRDHRAGGGFPARNSIVQPSYQRQIVRPIYQRPVIRPIYQRPIYQRPVIRPIYQRQIVRPIYQRPIYQGSGVRPGYWRPGMRPFYQRLGMRPIYRPGPYWRRDENSFPPPYSSPPSYSSSPYSSPRSDSTSDSAPPPVYNPTANAAQQSVQNQTSDAPQPQVNDSDESIRMMQSLLNRVLGLNLPVDGVMNVETRSAIRSLLSKKDMPTNSPSEPAPIGNGANQPNQRGDDPNKSQGEFNAYEFYDNESDYFEFEEPGQPPQNSGKVTSGGGRLPASKGAAFALARVIPDDPNYQKYIPINYRLDAKKIIGTVAQDLSSRGKHAHFWVDLAHTGLVAAELFTEASIIVSGLAIAGPILGLVATGLALGAPYYEAAEEIAAKWSSTGFSRGVVMGADRRSAKLLKDYFGNDFFPRNDFFPKGRSIAMGNYRMGLLVGYVQGRVLSSNQHAIFHHDLGHRMGDQSYRGSSKQWTRREWIDWYITAAAVFRRDHLTA